MNFDKALKAVIPMAGEPTSIKPTNVEYIAIYFDSDNMLVGMCATDKKSAIAIGDLAFMKKNKAYLLHVRHAKAILTNGFVNLDLENNCLEHNGVDYPLLYKTFLPVQVAFERVLTTLDGNCKRMYVDNSLIQIAMKSVSKYFGKGTPISWFKTNNLKGDRVVHFEATGLKETTPMYIVIGELLTNRLKDYADEFQLDLPF